jgi:glycerate kinase
MEKGCRKFVIGLGGSATNDAGLGMLQALGFGFLNENNEKVGRGGQVLHQFVK